MHRALAECVALFADGIRLSTRPEDRKVASDYLAALAPLLASAVLGKDVLRELPGIDRLLGNTWLVDDKTFREGIAKWRTFRDEYEAWSLSAMTVNERLVALGTIDSFDRARSAGDKVEMERLLRAAHVDSSSIQRIIGDL